MRDSSRVSSRFWTGAVGLRLKRLGANAQLVALYLITCPHANDLGLYFLPVPYLSFDTGLPPDAAQAALSALEKDGFAHYDPLSSFVWVPDMAAWQLGDTLSPRDRRVIGVRNLLAHMPENPYLEPFTRRYREAFHL
ncbi:MAG: hypothetical protein OEY97_12620 [Nitrospirota bacterium]|nr:hypothetical protein [Nitrospirota bacterium]